MKAILGASNQEKALVGAFSVIVKTNGAFAALVIMETVMSTYRNEFKWLFESHRSIPAGISESIYLESSSIIENRKIL